MNDRREPHPKATELDGDELDQVVGGAAAKPAPAKAGASPGGNVTGMDDWEKHNV